ncbi:MAG: hypothetical protein Kow0047_09900 [Anaerolineae bacterium]
MRRQGPGVGVGTGPRIDGTGRPLAGSAMEAAERAGGALEAMLVQAAVSSAVNNAAVPSSTA